MKFPLLLVLVCALLVAQEWQGATSLPAVDMTGLTQAQKATVLKLLRDEECTCGCGMKMAECRVKDPNCTYSKGLAATIVDAIRAGKSEAEAVKVAEASRFGKAYAPKLLEDPINIPVMGAPIIGPANAPVTLVEFSDFQCPYCIKTFGDLQAVMKAYPTQVRLIFKQFPLDRHSQAALAASAALAAHKQGKFWSMHDALFNQRGKLSRAIILQLAGGLQLDMKRFEADMDSADLRKAVDKDVADGEKAGVNGTPTIFIDGQHYNGATAPGAMKPVLDGELKKHAGDKLTAVR